MFWSPVFDWYTGFMRERSRKTCLFKMSVCSSVYPYVSVTLSLYVYISPIYIQYLLLYYSLYVYMSIFFSLNPRKANEFMQTIENKIIYSVGYANHGYFSCRESCISAFFATAGSSIQLTRQFPRSWRTTE